jgi:hypothetical protein
MIYCNYFKKTRLDFDINADLSEDFLCLAKPSCVRQTVLHQTNRPAAGRPDSAVSLSAFVLHYIQCLAISKLTLSGARHADRSGGFIFWPNLPASDKPSCVRQTILRQTNLPTAGRPDSAVSLSAFVFNSDHE